MKGKSTFTAKEISTIKKLITEKLHATPSKQKGIRQKIRNIGFYYSDFCSDKDGYTVEDFEALIHTGKVTVIDDSVLSSFKPLNKVLLLENTVREEVISQKSIDVAVFFQAFKANRFDSLPDNETKIPDMAGNYILCLRPNSKLPKVRIEPILELFDGLQVIYTGIASKSLRKRDYKQHFKGNNAGKSTLRKSLGVLFGYKQIPRDSDPTTGKTKFGVDDEIKLTEWMRQNLILYFFPTTDFEQIENQAIIHFNPPLNLKGNNNLMNRNFRELLSQLRAKKN